MIKLCLCIIFILILTTANASVQIECLEFHVISNAPIGFENANNKKMGVHWEYLTALEKETGICINKTILPYARIWQNLKYGVHDGGIVFKSESRSNIVDYVAPIRTVNTVVIPVNGININHYNDLHGLIVAKTRGTHLSKKFDQDTGINIIELNNYSQAAQMIKHGRIDAIAGSALVLSYQLKKHNILNRINHKSKLILGEKEQWLQLSKKSKYLDKIPALKEAITKLQQDGTFNLIMDKYYGKQWRLMNQ